VGGACGRHGRTEKSVQGFGGESPKERHNSEDRRWGDEIRMDLCEIGWGNVERIQLAQDRAGGGLL
jgi:hypothetical protein